MSITPQLLPIEINLEKRKNMVLTNVIKMLTDRKLLNVDKLEDNIKTITETLSDDQIYKITLDNPDVYYANLDKQYKSTFYVKLLNHKITSVTKTSLIGEFMLGKYYYPKLIIVANISGKVYDQIQNTYKNTEVFSEKELMINIVDHIAVPKHVLCDHLVTKQVLDEYMVKKKEMPKIYLNDPITKYYNGSLGQSFYIERPSETSGIAPYHRLIIKGVVKAK